MRQIRVPLSAMAIAVALVASSVWASDYICRQATCVGHIVDGPILKKVVLNRGDVVSTDDGWVISELDGWEELP